MHSKILSAKPSTVKTYQLFPCKMDPCIHVKPGFHTSAKARSTIAKMDADEETIPTLTKPDPSFPTSNTFMPVAVYTDTRASDFLRRSTLSPPPPLMYSLTLNLYRPGKAWRIEIVSGPPPAMEYHSMSIRIWRYIGQLYMKILVLL